MTSEALKLEKNSRVTEGVKFWKGQMTSHGDMKYPTSIWEFPKPHPSIAISSTEKPIDLCRYAIRTYTNEHAVVLDNCCGSGSVLIAAKMENRHFIGMDNGICDNCKNQYFGMPWADVATKRLESVRPLMSEEIAVLQ